MVVDEYAHGLFTQAISHGGADHLLEVIEEVGLATDQEPALHKALEGSGLGGNPLLPFRAIAAASRMRENGVEGWDRLRLVIDDGLRAARLRENPELIIGGPHISRAFEPQW